MSSLLFVNGQVRALEPKLLDVNRLDRMIGATSPEDAFRVLVELQYAEYFDESTKAQDFAQIIQQGLQETKALLSSGTDNHLGLRFLWLEFDLNNLKRALKLKHLKGDSSLEVFSEAEGFSPLGNLSQEDLSAGVFEDRFGEHFPEAFVEVVRQAESILEAHEHNFRFVEFACDQAYFTLLQDIVAQTKNEFLKKLLVLKADLANIRMVARNILVLEEALPKEAFIQFGNLQNASWAELKDFSEFLKHIKQTSFWAVAEDLSEDQTPEENIHSFEKALDKAYGRFLHDAQEGEIDSIGVAFHYFERRLQNARLLKFVMFAKFHGLDPEVIYKTLEQL